MYRNHYSYSSTGGSMRSKRARRRDSTGRSYNRRRWLRRPETQFRRRAQEKEREWTSWRIYPGLPRHTAHLYGKLGYDRPARVSIETLLTISSTVCEE